MIYSFLDCEIKKNLELKLKVLNQEMFKWKNNKISFRIFVQLKK